MGRRRDIVHPNLEVNSHLVIEMADLAIHEPNENLRLVKVLSCTKLFHTKAGLYMFDLQLLAKDKANNRTYKCFIRLQQRRQKNQLIHQTVNRFELLPWPESASLMSRGRKIVRPNLEVNSHLVIEMAELAIHERNENLRLVKVLSCTELFHTKFGSKMVDLHLLAKDKANNKTYKYFVRLYQSRRQNQLIHQTVIKFEPLSQP
ncbi:hypothetical protein PIB30_004191 [Stylosanthes scabra]|uniref:Uncharacterized protein n=1 Tax=Stylosanthes scabra TaxID=79078 RepID=A0ABU6R3X1_9FABA|nr:hypothetical protein [Stylosanthes scabra]